MLSVNVCKGNTKKLDDRTKVRKKLVNFAPAMKETIKDFEIMAPVGSRDALAAALKAGADSVYFGVEQLNMRSHSANHFTIDDLRDIATSLSEMNGENLSRVELFRAVLEEFDKLYCEVCESGFDKVIELWKGYNVTLGKNVRVISASEEGEIFTGKAVDLNADGALVVETAQGLRTVYAGDVSIR